VEEQVEGVPERGGLLQQIRPKQEEFRGAIRRTAPCFVPRYKSDTPDEPVGLCSPVTYPLGSPASVELCSSPALYEPVERCSSVRVSEGDESVGSFSPDPGHEKWEPHQRFLFLKGEEDYEEIGWNDGRETFIDDVLERAEWYAILYISRLISCPLHHPFDPGRSRENYQTTTPS
jgi:hypothetical protein